MVLVPVNGTADRGAAKSVSAIKERKTAVFELQRVVVVFIRDFLDADPPTPRLRRDRVGKELGELPRGEGEELPEWDEVFIG
jgi:hypothetical protein